MTRVTKKDVVRFAIAGSIALGFGAWLTQSKDTSSTPENSSRDGFQMAYDWCQPHGGLINTVTNDTYYTVQGICADRTTSPSFPY